MPKREDLKKILVIGSGPIIIGQAAEFDYAGAQACLALKEEGYKVVLINSNPATIMTDSEMADTISRLSNKNKVAILSIAGLYGSITPDARKVDINKDEAYTLAIALVINELSQRLLANFFFKLRRINYPVKTFKNEDEATEWLHQQIRANQQTG